MNEETKKEILKVASMTMENWGLIPETFDYDENTDILLMANIICNDRIVNIRMLNFIENCVLSSKEDVTFNVTFNIKKGEN